MPSVEKGGIAQFYMGNALIKLGASAEIDMGGEVRKVATGLSGVVGYTTEIAAPMIEVELYADQATSLKTVRAFEAATVQLNMNNGSSFTLTDAFFTGGLKFDAAKGTYKAQFSGFTMVEGTA